MSLLPQLESSEEEMACEECYENDSSEEDSHELFPQLESLEEEMAYETACVEVLLVFRHYQNSN